jgi:hypothetical protein
MAAHWVIHSNISVWLFVKMFLCFSQYNDLCEWMLVQRASGKPLKLSGDGMEWMNFKAWHLKD